MNKPEKRLAALVTLWALVFGQVGVPTAYASDRGRDDHSSFDNQRGATESPIKHLIVIIGENRRWASRSASSVHLEKPRPRPFPADDEHLIKLMRVTGDHSPLLTLCELLGYEPPQPKPSRMSELIVDLAGDIRLMEARMHQLQLALGESEKGRPKR